MSNQGHKNRSLRVTGNIEQTDGSKLGRPEFEVWAPDGYNFGGAHSLVERDTEECIKMRTQDMLLDLERCGAGCECGWDEP